MSDNLDLLLKKRSVPKVSDDLADRIVAAAQVRKEEPQIMIVFQMFRPVHLAVLAVAFVIFAGVFVTGGDVLDETEVTMDEIAMYMVYESLEIPEQSML